MRAIQQSQFGGPGVLKLVDASVPAPSDDEILIRVSLCGVNFADILGRESGNNHIAMTRLPAIPGAEVAGVREDTGERVVAICGSGGYAQWAAAPLSRIFAVPDGVDDHSALALAVQGLTAWFLYHGAGGLKSTDTVVVHAAAGGVGSLALQLGKLLGARRLIATASTEAKRELAVELGADATTDSDAQGLTERLLAANDGHPIDLILERAGGAVFDGSLAALAPCGRMVVYGNSSGDARSARIPQLISRSLTISGLWLMDYLRDRDASAKALRQLFHWCAAGALKPVLGAMYPLHEAASAHIDIAGRATIGKLVLNPNV